MHVFHPNTLKDEQLQKTGVTRNPLVSYRTELSPSPHKPPTGNSLFQILAKWLDICEDVIEEHKQHTGWLPTSDMKRVTALLKSHKSSTGEGTKYVLL